MKFFLIIVSLIFLNFSNIYCFAAEKQENNDILKIGLIVPLSGEKGEIGKSILNSLRLALTKINDDKIEIFPKDNASDPEKTLIAAKQLENEGIQIIIGPIFYENLIYLKEVENLTFLSLTNKNKNIPNNVIALGISAYSQIDAITDFLKSEKKKKTIILIPNAQYKDELTEAISRSDYKFSQIYSYDIEPNKLTSQIEQITKYNERKKKLERRIKILENSTSEINTTELNNLKKRYTLGEVNFDSVVIADFGENLKSIINSFSYADVSAEDVTFITMNQWFDETLFNEASINKAYFPSISYENYFKYNNKYFKEYNKYPSLISILSYDVLGLIYYLNKKNEQNNFKKIISDKKKYFVGEIGEFYFNKNKVIHKLYFYQILENEFIQIN